MEENATNNKEEELLSKNNQISLMQTQIEKILKEKEQNQETITKLREESSQAKSKLANEKAVFD